MTSQKIIAKIERVYFQYSKEGHFSPSIGMSHADISTDIPNYFYITAWEKNASFPEEIGIDDILSLDVEEQFTNRTYRCLSASRISCGPGPKHLTFPVACPACGGLVLVSAEHPEIRVCLNRSCPAQIRNSVIEFLATIGTRLTPMSLRILHQLIGCREICSIAEIYSITDDMIRKQGYSQAEAKEYLKCIKSSRGKVSFDKILKGLGIFGLNQQELETLQKEMYARKIALASWSDILNADNLGEDIADIVYRLRTYFLAMSNNEQTLQEVCRALN